VSKVVPAESASDGAKRIVKSLWPSSGNNTEARRTEKPQTKTDREIDAAEEGKSK
jgi:hypothetical protein